MAIESVACPILGAHVTRVTDLEGKVTQIICAEYEPTGTCRLKKSALNQGPLAQFVERAAEGTLSSRDLRCVLH